MTKTLDKNEIAALMGCKANSAIARLVTLGYTEVCSRCGGSGRYSYNQVDGDRCFGCAGAGKKLAKITAAVVTEALERIAAGELTSYFAENKARREIKAAVEETQAAWKTTRIATEYTASKLPAAELVESPLYRAMVLINKLMERAWEQDFPRAKGTGLERIAIVRAAGELILAVDRAWSEFTK